jgi:hypothetical protein
MRALENRGGSNQLGPGYGPSNAKAVHFAVAFVRPSGESAWLYKFEVNQDTNHRERVADYINSSSIVNKNKGSCYLSGLAEARIFMSLSAHMDSSTTIKNEHFSSDFD